MKPVYKRMVRKMNEGAGSEPSPGQGEGVSWSLYILACADGSFYTGVTTDPERRLAEHNAGRASRYTRTRRPVVMVYREACGTRGCALARECAVKEMPRRAKEKLIGEKNA